MIHHKSGDHLRPASGSTRRVLQITWLVSGKMFNDQTHSFITLNLILGGNYSTFNFSLDEPVVSPEYGGDIQTKVGPKNHGSWAGFQASFSSSYLRVTRRESVWSISAYALM